MASGKGNNNSIGFLQLLFQGTISADYATLALNATSSPATNLFVSLHTANPGAGGSQTTSEAAYGGYGRVAVVRTSAGWQASGEGVNNVGAVTFPTSSSGSETEEYVGIGTNGTTGAGVLLWFGALTANLAVMSAGITPSFAANALSVTES